MTPREMKSGNRTVQGVVRLHFPSGFKVGEHFTKGSNAQVAIR